MHCVFHLIAMVTCFSTCMMLHAQTLSMKEIHKEAAKEAKALGKEGWVAVGRNSIKEQIEQGICLQHELMTDDEDNPIKRYILVSAEEQGVSPEVATTKARSYCEALLAQSLQMVITAMIDHERTTSQISATEAETKEQTILRSESESKVCLQHSHTIRHLIKKNEDGTVSVQIMLSLDKKKLINP